LLISYAAQFWSVQPFGPLSLTPVCSPFCRQWRQYRTSSHSCCTFRSLKYGWTHFTPCNTEKRDAPSVKDRHIGLSRRACIYVPGNVVLWRVWINPVSIFRTEISQ
jgi:hypothetical protein